MDSRKLERVASFGGRMGPVWLKDSRRLLLQHNGKLYVLDTDSRNVREIFSVVPHSIDPPALSADNSLMYFSVVTTEADIWLASMP
jgi:hypothetical protein